MTIKTSITTSLLAASALFVAAGMAQATTVDFDSAADCTSSDFTIASPGNLGNCALGGAPGGSLALVQSSLVRGVPTDRSYWEVAFSTAVSNVSIDLGDFNQDADRLFLWAWDVNGVAGSVEFDIDEAFNGMMTLSLGLLGGITGIAFGTINSSGGGLGVGGIYADNLTYTLAAPVPVPAALPLMLSGLGALGFAGWRRKRNAA